MVLEHHNHFIANISFFQKKLNDAEQSFDEEEEDDDDDDN